jgi:hypothetical protein
MFNGELLQTQNIRSHLKPLHKSNCQTPAEANYEYKFTWSNKTITKSQMYVEAFFCLPHGDHWWGQYTVHVSSHKTSVICRIFFPLYFEILAKVGIAGHFFATFLNSKHFIHIYSGTKYCNRLCCTGNGEMQPKTVTESEENDRFVYLRELISVYQKS